MLITVTHFRNACPCGTFPETEADNLQLENYTAAYQQGLLDIAASEDYHTDNFTLVAQRFFENLTLPYTVRILTLKLWQKQHRAEAAVAAATAALVLELIVLVV